MERKLRLIPWRNWTHTRSEEETEDKPVIWEKMHSYYWDTPVLGNDDAQRKHARKYSVELNGTILIEQGILNKEIPPINMSRRWINFKHAQIRSILIMPWIVWTINNILMYKQLININVTMYILYFFWIQEKYQQQNNKLSCCAL